MPGGFKLSAGAIDPLAAPAAEDDEDLRLKYQEFYSAGGRVIEAPSQGIGSYYVVRTSTLNASCCTEIALARLRCYVGR